VSGQAHFLHYLLPLDALNYIPGLREYIITSFWENLSFNSEQPSFAVQSSGEGCYVRLC